MTDTTDIASLLAKMLEQTKRFETVIIKDHEVQRLVAAFEMERQCRMAAEASVGVLEGIIARKEFDAQQADEWKERAENASAGWLKVIDERDALAQKSRNYEQVAHGLAEETAALKAKLANPVVLPVVQDIGGDEWYWKDGIIRNIQEAGFTVKGGE